MDKFEIFTKEKGWEAAQTVVEIYKSEMEDFDDSFVSPMHYASGYTSATLAKEIASKWLKPLKQKARIASISALISVLLLLATMFHVWSLVDFESFSMFLMTFIPSLGALLFTLSKSYKSWAEAKKHIAEAQAISNKD